MKLVIEPMNTLPCRLEVFAINGKNANQNDFVYAYDHDIENAETDTCSDMQIENYTRMMNAGNKKVLVVHARSFLKLIKQELELKEE